MPVNSFPNFMLGMAIRMIFLIEIMPTAIPITIDTRSCHTTHPKTALASPIAPRMDMKVPVKSLGMNNTKRPQPDRGLIRVIPERRKRKIQMERMKGIIRASSENQLISTTTFFSDLIMLGTLVKMREDRSGFIGHKSCFVILSCELSHSSQ